MKNNEKVELLLHYDEPIIITKDKFDEFEHKFSEFLDPENYLDFGSSVYQALEALNFLDPNGKYFLYAEYAVYDEDWDAHTGLFECAFVNCDCPDFLKNKFDGEFLITEKYTKFSNSDSQYFKKIKEEFYEGEPEISNSGVICFKYDNTDLKELFEHHL